MTWQKDVLRFWREGGSTPGVTFAIVAHDDWCPMKDTGQGTCICKPDVSVVDRDQYMASVSRAARRKAEREAMNAARRAAKGNNHD